MGNSGSNSGPDLNTRRGICHENSVRSNEYANWANDRANDANNHVNNIQNQALEFANEADGIVNQVKEIANNAGVMIRTLKTSIQTYSDQIVTETDEERADLNKIVTTADTEINIIDNTKAKLVRDAADTARSYADNVRSAANTGTNNGQQFADEARNQANISRSKADECYNIEHSGDGGDDQRSTNTRNEGDGAYQNAIQNMEQAQNVTVNSSAYNLLNNVKGQIEIANQKLRETSDAIVNSTELKKVFKLIDDYGLDHSFNYLYNEIARIKPLKDDLEKNVLPKDIKEETDILKEESDYNTSLNDYLDKLKAEKGKGSLADQTSKELADLEKELKICTDIIVEYQTTIGLTNGRIGILAQELVREQTNLTDHETTKKTKFDEMTQAEKNYNDLSGQLIKLQNDKSSLKNLISLQESKYNDLIQRIEKLNKNITELNIEDYSTKVYNNQNLLQLNKTIDKDLQNIFSHLKTENINPDLLYTKTKYRVIEEDKLSNLDKLLDVLFYCFYFSFIIIRIVTRNTNTEDFLMYILIGLIPFIYPFMYKNSNYIIRLFHLDINKNAFIETEPETEPEISIDAYNI